MGSAASTSGHRVDELRRITPELVLVDPDLSRRVRPRVPLLFRRRTPPLPVLHHVSQPPRGGEPAGTAAPVGQRG